MAFLDVSAIGSDIVGSEGAVLGMETEVETEEVLMGVADSKLEHCSLAHEPQNKNTKIGLRDTDKKFKWWSFTVLAEASESQSVVQRRMCAVTRQNVADGCTNLSFLKAYQTI